MILIDLCMFFVYKMNLGLESIFFQTCCFVLIETYIIVFMHVDDRQWFDLGWVLFLNEFIDRWFGTPFADRKRYVALFKGFPLQVTPYRWWRVMWIFIKFQIFERKTPKATRLPYTFHTTRVMTSLRMGSFRGPKKSWLRVVWSLGDRGKTQHLGLRLSPVVCCFLKKIYSELRKF